MELDNLDFTAQDHTHIFPSFEAANDLELSILSPLGQFPTPLMDNYLLPLTVNISVALCTYTASLFMYIVSIIGMEGEIQFVCFIVSNNKHIKCSLLLIEGKDQVRCRYIYMVAEKKFKNVKSLHVKWGGWR